MDDFDDFGISDDVLNELFDLQRGGGAPPPPAPSPPAEPLPPPPAEWQQPPTEWQQPPPPDEHVYPNMFEDFDAPGPLQPQDHSAVTALPAYEGHEGHAALDVQQLRGELEQAIRQRQEALNDKQQLEGERMILRSKLEQASQGGVHERQQLQHLKSQLDGIRAEKHMEYDSTVNKLKTDLSFKSQELEAAMRENAQLKAQAAEQQQAPGQAARLPTAGGARPRGGALTPHALRTPRPLCDSGSVPPQPGIGHPLPPPLATLGQQQSNASPLFRPTPGAASRKRSAGSGSPSKAAPPPSAAAPLLPQQPRAQTPSPAASTSRTPDANQQQQQQQAPLFTPAPRDRPSAHRPSGLPVPPPTAALLAVAPTDESDESPLGMLGNEILEILEELKKIKRRLAFTVTPESQPIQQAMVVGVPGAGKSTLVNELMRHCLKMEDDQPSEPEEVVIRDDVFSEGGSAKPGTVRMQLLATQRDEEAVLEQTKKDKNVEYRFNISGDDILPTGSGAGAMTALVTHIFLDPTASHLQLRLKYREKAEVDKVLGYADTIREHGRAVKRGESLPELPDIKDGSGRDVDVTTQAYFACALLGLENKPDGDKDGDGSDDGSDDDDDVSDDAPDAGVEQLQRHVGAFELPTRFEPLYGCERRLTLQGGSKSKLLAQIQELLLVHTIGHWSHWAVRLTDRTPQFG